MNDDEFYFDTSVLSNFARIERLELLWKFTEKIRTTRDVIEEVQKGIPKRPQLSSIIKAQTQGRIILTSSASEETILLMNDLRLEGVLGRGEISVMGVAREVGGIFVTDDERATKKAQKLKIKVLDPIEYRDTIIILKTLMKNSNIDRREFFAKKKY